MIKIAIIGPESTGKTELAQYLASHFDGEWIPEYARSYVENLERAYNYNDICFIAEKQIEIQKNFELNNTSKFVFFDTDLIITKVWFEHCYQQAPDFLIQSLNENYFDLYLLCFPDLPWVPDLVREHGDDREYFFEWYKKEIKKLGTKYFIVTGQEEHRSQNAIDFIVSTFQIK